MIMYPHNLGAAGEVQMFKAGTISFDDAGIAQGKVLCTVPKGMVVLKAVADVTKGFNAATTNVVTVGLKNQMNEIIPEDLITEGTVGTYTKDMFFKMGEETEVYAKYTQTGTPATAGSVDIFLMVVPASIQ